MTAIRWIARHWYIPLIGAVALVGFLLGSRRGPRMAVRDELRAIDAGEKARLDAVDMGADAANEKADLQYKHELETLNARQAVKAERLRRDPAARVRWLERLASKG